MKSVCPAICLLTDFGLDNHYVGTLKGVLLSYAPEASLIDLTHHIPPQNVRRAAFELLAAYRYQPEGSFFLCVVDPGVGTERNILFVEAGAWWFVAPDNGLLSWVLDEIPPTGVLKINAGLVNPAPSATFHGRDIMAPLIGKILSGEPPDRFGTAATDWAKLPFPEVVKLGSQWRGEVIHADAYGNLVTNFRAAEVARLAAASQIWLEFEKFPGTIRGLSGTYSSVEPGRLLALQGSNGFIEIAVNQGSAEAKMKLSSGDRVTLYFRS